MQTLSRLVLLLLALLLVVSHVDASRIRLLNRDQSMVACAEEGEPDAVRELLTQGAHIEARERFDGKTALIAGAGADEHSDEVVFCLLDRGAKVNVRDWHGRTALMMAAENGHLAALKLLLDRGAAIDRQDEDGRTALQYALLQTQRDRRSQWGADKTECANLLRERGAHVGLAEVALNADPEPLRRQLAVNASFTARQRAVALLGASYMNLPQNVRLLLESGVDPNAADHTGTSALMEAAHSGNLACMEALLTHEANANARDREGRTALMWANEPNGDYNAHYADVAGLLLAHGMDINERDRVDDTALIRIAQNHFGEPEQARWLLEHGADPNIADRKGNTALIHAAWIPGGGTSWPKEKADPARMEMVQLLLAYGANPNGDRRFDSTPLEIADKIGDAAVVTLLQRAGAQRNSP